MRVLVVGCRGMLGSSCLRAFGSAAVGCDVEEIDIADRESVARTCEARRPNVIVNCAAATDVDRCETDHEYADRANAVGPGVLAEAASLWGARLVHVSTDFVFAGTKGAPYSEEDEPDPLNHYGRSKLQGERAVFAALPDALVVRTSWLYGEGTSHFPAKVLAWAAGNSEIKVPFDNFGSPTYAEDLAAAIRHLVSAGARGLFHVAGSGCASRLELAEETVAVREVAVRLIPVTGSTFVLPARRPDNTCLDCSKAVSSGVRLPPWRDALRRYLATPAGRARIVP